MFFTHHYTEGINASLDAIERSADALNEEKPFRTAGGHIEPSEFEKIKDFKK